MTVHHNYPENFIDDPEYFHQYCSWLLIIHEINTIQPTNNQVSNVQLYGGSNYHILTNIIISNYIIPVDCNVKILNGINPLQKVLVFFLKHYYTTLAIMLYNTKPTNTISQNTLKHYNKFRSVIIVGCWTETVRKENRRPGSRRVVRARIYSVCSRMTQQLS